jgi:hypothetical protein
MTISSNSMILTQIEIDKKNKIDILTSSIRPQFEIDRFKNVKKAYSINRNHKLIISSTLTNSFIR